MVSIIVPVYNVENYLNDCLDSITKQTYTDLEIILVDDGSKDKSGELCDEWATKDSRIVVFHKKNGGLSSARNYGLDRCNGEYISFVDSDDIVSNDMIQHLKDGIENGCILSACPIKCFDDGNFGQFKSFYPQDKGEMSSNQFLCSILKHKIDNAVWNKMYRRDLLGNIRFIEGIINEDFPFIVEYISSNGIVNILDAGSYYYRQRNGSITQQANPHIFDFIKNGLTIKNKLGTKYAKLCDGYICYECTNLMSTIEKFNAKKEFINEIEFCNKYVSNSLFHHFFNLNWSIIQKIKFLLVSVFPKLYRILVKFK